MIFCWIVGALEQKKHKFKKEIFFTFLKPNHKMKLLKNLPSGTFTYLVIVLVMTNNIEHLAFVHYNIARHWFSYDWMNHLHSVVVVVIIELSIIELVRRGKISFAGFYTFCLFILSLIYYPLYDYVLQAAWGNLIAAIVFSFMFTISIYYFAILAAEKKDVNNESDIKKRHVDTTKMLLEAENKLILFDAMKTELEELRIFKAFELSKRICPHCNETFPSENSKRGHMANCKK